MLFTTHLCVGAVIGRLAPSPLVAGLAGLVSHLALDTVPHWGNPDPDAFYRAARRDGLIALGVSAVVLIGSPRHRLAVAAGMAGAGVLDLDKPFREFLGFSPFPDRVDAFHAAIQRGREAPGRWPVDLATGVAAGLTLIWLQRRCSTDSTDC